MEFSNLASSFEDAKGQMRKIVEAADKLKVGLL